MSQYVFRRHAILVAAAVAAAVPMAGIRGAAADPIAPGREHCVINVRSNDALNMRTAPRATAEVVARKPYGVCGILVTGSCRASWCPVEDGHALGWAHRHYIAAVSAGVYCVSNVAANDVLNMRAFPSPQSRIVAALAPRRCGITVLPYRVGSWQKVRAAGRYGWVNSRYLVRMSA
jgi:SH3-like domain-containing protein